jgi:hypothetical protein
MPGEVVVSDCQTVHGSSKPTQSNVVVVVVHTNRLMSVLYKEKPKGFYLKSIKRPMTDDQTLKSAEVTLL